MKLTKFFISKTKQIYTKTLTVPESALEIKAMLRGILFKILLTSAKLCATMWKRSSAIARIMLYVKSLVKSHNVENNFLRWPF